MQKKGNLDLQAKQLGASISKSDAKLLKAKLDKLGTTVPSKGTVTSDNFGDYTKPFLKEQHALGTAWWDSWSIDNYITDLEDNFKNPDISYVHLFKQKYKNSNVCNSDNFALAGTSMSLDNSDSLNSEKGFNACEAMKGKIPHHCCPRIINSEKCPKFQDELKIIASLNGSYDFSENLTATVTSGVDYESEVTLDTQDPRGFNQLYFNPNSAGTQSQRSYRTAAFNTTAALNWNKEIGKHTIGVGLYSEYFKAHFRYIGFTANGLNPKTFFPGDGSGFIDDNATNDLFVDTVGADMKDAGLLSYFTNMNYDYDSKYGMSLTYRRDASYRFSKTNRWADFWAVSARWNIDKENFMEDSVFNSLKLRGSYGTSGNQRISGSNYFSAPDLASNFFATGTGYAGAQTIALSQLGNDTLKWETVAQANVGIDFALFNSRLRGSFDYYRKETTDLFQSLPLSAITGTTSLAANTGSMHNNGFDFDLTYDLIRGSDLNVSISAVGNINDNYLADIPNETGEIIGIGRNGGPIGERYEIRYAGVNPANGNVLFLDKDDNLTETPDADTDRVWTGKNLTPEVQGSFSFNGDYKGFFIQAQFNYTLGVDFSDFDYANFVDPSDIGTFNLSSDILRAWTPENRVTDIPTIFPGSNVGVYDSDRYVVSRDFLRLRFLTFGYNFPKEYLDKTNISNLRLFMNGENLVTLTKFRGYDASSRTTGRSYPTPRIFSLGLEISL